MSQSIQPIQPAAPAVVAPPGAASASGGRVEGRRSPAFRSRRVFLLTGGGALGLATLGCGQAAPSGQSPSAAPVDLSLLWVTRPGEETLWGDVYPKLLAARHPNIRATMEMVPASGDYWAGLLTKAVSLTAAGTPPDASRNAGLNARQLLKQGFLKDLAGYTRTSKYPFAQHFGAAFPAHLKGADGKINGLPVSILSVVRYVNKTLLTQVGIKAPTDWATGNWTQAQMLENARRLSRGAGADRTFGMRMQMNAVHGQHWFWANGAAVIDDQGAVRINEGAAIDTLQHGMEYVNQQLSPSADDLRATPLNTLFTSGRLAMMDLSQSSIPAIANAAPVFEWGLMPTSTGKSGKAYAVQLTDFWYVHNGSKQAESAYRAIEVLNGEDFEVAMARNQTGGIPTLKTVAEKFTKELFKVDPAVSLTSLDHSREPYYAVNQQEWQALVDKHVNAMWAGQASPRQAAENIVREAQPILAPDKERA